MVFGVVVYFDPESEAKLTKQWKLLQEANIPVSLSDAGVRPHLSIGVADDGDPTKLQSLIGNTNLPEFPSIVAESVGEFLTGGVVYLGVVKSPALLQCHEFIFSLFEKVAKSPQDYYRPGNWIPHITMSQKLSQEDLVKAKEIIQQISLPLEMKIMEIGIAQLDQDYRITFEWTKKLDSTSENKQES
jgi:2'-5' RNA ligase